jgi:hypothetical protein
LTLTDGGALSALTVGMNGAAASLNTAGNGFAVKTGLGTVTPRNIAVSGSGIDIADGDGQSGNPTIFLNGLPLALANASGAGIVALSGSGTLSPRIITGTADQIVVANGDGASADPVVSLASNPIVPGNASLTVPTGTTAERPVGVDGMVRYNTDAALFEGYLNGSWNSFASGSGVTSIATGNGLTGGPITSTGTIAIDTSIVTTLTGTQTLTNKTLTSPVLTTPALGTPASGVMTNVTGLPLATGVTGTLPVLNGGTGATDATTARSNLSAAKSGVNTDITSIALTTGTVSTSPSAGIDIANKQYVDDTAQGLNFHAACNNATTANLTATYNNGTSGVGATLTNSGALAALTVDGTLQVVGNRVLVKNQSTASENGAYTVTTVGSGAIAWVLTRATDFDTAGSGANQIDAGDFFYIINGSTNANTSWVQQTPLPIIVGTTSIVFIQFGAAAAGVTSFSAGTTGFTPNTATTGNVTLGGTLAVANGGTGVVTSTGTGSVVLSDSPSLVTPALGTPASGTLTNVTGLPISTGVSGLGANVATFLATPSSSNLAAAVTDETGSGSLVFATSPTLVTPALGTPSSATLTNATGLPLTTGVTGTLPIANGGTNSTATATAGGSAYGTGTAFAFTAAGTAGQVLTSAGASAPTWSGISGGTF